jgi:hypothetical protein
VTRPAVLVLGPSRAGVTSLVAALAQRMTDIVVTETAGETVGAVVFAVSAVAPMTQSDCVVLEESLEVVLEGAAVPAFAALTKVDAHRGWRDVLAADRAALAARGPLLRDVPWVGVAAAPDSGEPDVDDLVAALRGALGDVTGLSRRRLCGLEDRRRRIVRDHRRQRSVNALTARGGIQQARVSLTYRARNRCALMVADLRAEAATLARSETVGFESRVRDAAAALAAEVDLRIDQELAVLADPLGVPLPVARPADSAAEVTDPMPTSRPEENQLMLVLGVGFGLGVALASGRLLTSFVDGLDVVGLVAGAVLGLGVTVWVVGLRALLHTRAAFDRWVIEVGAAARSAADARIATRLLAAEVTLSSSAAERDHASAAETASLLAAIDAEIRALKSSLK